jgi:hypothetical protein
MSSAADRVEPVERGWAYMSLQPDLEAARAHALAREAETGD